MTNISYSNRLQDWVVIVLAGCLFLSPWVFGFTGEQYPAWNAWISAAAIAAVAVAALLARAEWEEWVRLVLGVWVVVAPWILGFVASAYALWVHVVLGLLVIAVTAWEIWDVRQRPRATA